MGMNVGIFCYGCLFGSKRMGAGDRIFLWIDFDWCDTVISCMTEREMW